MDSDPENIVKSDTSKTKPKSSVYCYKCQPRDGWQGARAISSLKNNFGKWTSGHPDVDAFIQKTQLNATGFHDYLEWIPYDHLQDINFLAEGGFAKVHSATWIGGCRRNLPNNPSSMPFHVPNILVALKCPHNQEEIGQLLNEIRVYVTCIKQSHNFEKDHFYDRTYRVLRCYGITCHPSQGYMMVTEYASRGDLRGYLRQMRDNAEKKEDMFGRRSKFKWCDRLYILRDIVKGLAIIHDAGLLHGDLHPGNVLQMDDNRVILGNAGNYYQSNASIRPSRSYSTSGIFGVIPYMAPEVLRGKKYTKAADMYSFAMIMSEVASGEPPFVGRLYDASLVLDICDGVRPRIANGTPECFVELLTRCWDGDPLKRPDTKEVLNTLDKWAKGLDNNIRFRFTEGDPEISKQFRFADNLERLGQKSSQLQLQNTISKTEDTVQSSTQYITRQLELTVDCDQGNEFLQDL